VVTSTVSGDFKFCQLLESLTEQGFDSLIVFVTKTIKESKVKSVIVKKSKKQLSIS
jgi:hypothetical protein